MRRGNGRARTRIEPRQKWPRSAAIPPHLKSGKLHSAHASRAMTAPTTGQEALARTCTRSATRLQSPSRRQGRCAAATRDGVKDLGNQPCAAPESTPAGGSNLGYKFNCRRHVWLFHRQSSKGFLSALWRQLGTALPQTKERVPHITS